MITCQSKNYFVSAHSSRKRTLAGWANSGNFLAKYAKSGSSNLHQRIQSGFVLVLKAMLGLKPWTGEINPYINRPLS